LTPKKNVTGHYRTRCGPQPCALSVAVGPQVTRKTNTENRDLSSVEDQSAREQGVQYRWTSTLSSIARGWSIAPCLAGPRSVEHGIRLGSYAATARCSFNNEANRVLGKDRHRRGQGFISGGRRPARDSERFGSRSAAAAPRSSVLRAGCC
jgi:hypothetical protein